MISSGILGFLIFLLLFIQKAVEKVIQRKYFVSKFEKAKISSEALKTLRKNAERYNSPDTFVKFAKMQREANQHEKKLEALWKEIKSYRGSVAAKSLYYFKILYMILCCLLFWNVPMAVLSFEIPIWLKYITSFPHSLLFRNQSRYIHIIPWLFFCDKSIQTALDLLLPIDIKYLELTKKLQHF